MHFRQVFDQVFSLETWIAAVVFGLVLAAMAAAVLISRVRRRRGLPPLRRDKHNPLEMTYLLGLTGIAVFLVVVSFTSNASFFRDPPPAMRVRVTAFQWCWTYQYLAERVSVTARCGPSGSIPTLVLPAGRPVQLQLTSRDVIHSFWVPELRVKMDIYPRHVNDLTVDLPVGRWLGRCAQYCGLYHYAMQFHLQALPPAQFSRWLHARGGPAGRS
jgi:cytochrome c oxidase subunit II